MICAKCFEVFNNSDEIYATLCGHCFHRGCIANNCNLCPSCFQVLNGSFNFIKLNAIFENEAQDNKEKMKKVIEMKEQNTFLKYQLHKTREDMQQMKNDLEKSRLQCAELKLDIEAERNMRRFHQLQLEGAITTSSQTETSSRTDDPESIRISSDEEPAIKRGRPLGSKKVKGKTKKVTTTSKIPVTISKIDCGGCKAGCMNRKCPCFKSSKGCNDKCGCQKCKNRGVKEKPQKLKKVATVSKKR